MKTYVYRKQFPLILAYAVTIHKSRVRSLSGVYLAAFDPKSIMVSVACLNKVVGYRSRLNNSTVATCVIL